MTALGVLGGSFNPPHVGHLALAKTAAEELGLKRVLLTPAYVAPHKPEASDPGPEHRLAMCRLLAEEDERLDVCTLELEREGPSYTVDTLRAIKATDPTAKLTLILGADMARTLPSWREPSEIAKLADLAVAARDGTERKAVDEALEKIPAADEASFLTMTPIEVSSSQVRDRVLARESCEGLLTGSVERYVQAHGLYREQGAVAQEALR